MISNPVLEKVFLALRPNFFPGVHTEHITLRYYNSIDWQTLLREAGQADKQLPATIHFKRFHKWNAEFKTFYGIEVTASDSTILDHLNMPHITLPFDTWNYTHSHDVPPVQIVDTLWIGKKINGTLVWAKVNNKQIGLKSNVSYDFGFPS